MTMSQTPLPDWIPPADLGARTGPAATGWSRLWDARVLAHGHYVAIPSAEWCAAHTEVGPPVRWLVPPRGSCLTDANALREALAATLLAPVPQGAPRG